MGSRWRLGTGRSLLLHWTALIDHPISASMPLSFVWANSESDGWIFAGHEDIEPYNHVVTFRYRLTSTPAMTHQVPTSTHVDVMPPSTTPSVPATKPTPATAVTPRILPPQESNNGLQFDLKTIALLALLLLVFCSISIMVIIRNRGKSR
jgi:hypothetical protein